MCNVTCHEMKLSFNYIKICLEVADDKFFRSI
jgi:hypothetical protein